MEEHGKRKKEKRNKMWLLIPAALMIVVLCAFFALRERDSLTINEPVSTCVNGGTVRWEEGVRLVRQNDKTTMKDDQGIINPDDYPLIKDDGSIVLQKSFSWNKTAGDQVYRVDYFTELSYENGKVRMNRRTKSAEASDGFLYDNEDVYIFLEPATLYIGGEGGEKINLSPMSIVQCVSNFNQLQIFGPGQKAVYRNDLATYEFVAVFANKRRVNLAMDHYYMENGEWRLLFRSLDLLKGMEQEVLGSETE